MQIQQRILEHSSQLFTRYGLRSVTMDDIARGLGISKKTIYRYYQNKTDIVMAFAQSMFEDDNQAMCKFANDAENAIDELVMIILWMIERFKVMSPQMIHDVHKYYPEVWALFEDHKSCNITQSVQDNLKRGISEGLYRQHIDADVVSIMRIMQIEQGLNENYFPSGKYDYRHVQLQLLEVYVYGIVSEKGAKLLQDSLEKDQDYLSSRRAWTSADNQNTNS